MGKMNILLILILLFGITSCGQVKNTSGQKQAVLIDRKQLIGRWYSESDTQYMLVFKKEKYIELYGKDTTDKMNYKLSSSCNLKDNSPKINLQKAYVLFYSNDETVHQCNEILNFKSDILSWLDNTNGKIFVFKKFK